MEDDWKKREEFNLQKRKLALQFTVPMGFDQSDVLQELVRLLKVYEGNWDFIESENYQTLVSALIDRPAPVEEDVKATTNVKPTTENRTNHATALLEDDAEEIVVPRRRKRELEISEPSKNRSNEKGKAVVENGTVNERRPKNKNTRLNTGEGSASAAGIKPGYKPPRHEPDDISKGSESVRIPWINTENNETIPDDFCYISASLIFDKAVVRKSLSSIGDTDCCRKTCFGNCANRKIPCECAAETDGVFMYKDEHLTPAFLEKAIKETTGQSNTIFCTGPCPTEQARGSLSLKCIGHAFRTFIKECCSKCTCHKTRCGNRIVQRGIRHKLQVFHTGTRKGWGIRCAEDLPAGAFVCEFVGEILTNNELHERNERMRNGTHTYPMLLNAEVATENICDDDTLLCLDATYYGNVARFINHRCGDANMVDVPVQIDEVDRHYYHVAFFTKRDVPANEELTWDYGMEFEDENHPVKAFTCICGSKNCRDTAAKPK